MTAFFFFFFIKTPQLIGWCQFILLILCFILRISSHSALTQLNFEKKYLDITSYWIVIGILGLHLVSSYYLLPVLRCWEILDQRSNRRWWQKNQNCDNICVGETNRSKEKRKGLLIPFGCDSHVGELLLWIEWVIFLGHTL